MKKYKIFIACDSSNISKVKEIIKKTQSNKLKVGYKFGLQFLNSKKSRNFLSKIKNHITFGDYKFSDIPNTCAEAVKSVEDLNFNYLTIHISAGIKALKKAKKVCGKTKLVGVTILTSLDNKSLREIGYSKSLKKLVIHQAKLAKMANLDAIVCSAQEVKLVKKVFYKEIITPGIRFGSQSQDQKRIATPKSAFEDGSDWIVMGRPISKGNIKKNIEKLINHLNQ